MAATPIRWSFVLLAFALLLVLIPQKAAAFGAGNIPSIAQVEGHNWRHGDIEDMLKTIAFLHGKKWTNLMVQRTYFGNWLRDYSQAVDVGSLKGVNAATIRILVWVLSFLAHGYATEEFEVTEERLGVYRPEEHIDNPVGYADGSDAREFDARLRGPVDDKELEIDQRTGMKNYIANESGGWATSAGYIRYSISRSCHYGRLYTSGAGGSQGREDDLCEALRCLGQTLHCLEDFSAHSNYCELALRALGYDGVFAHCGAATEMHLHGKRVFPLVTGSFGAVDFLHSVIGEANDHFTQSEVDEVDVALKNAEGSTHFQGSSGSRGFLGLGGGGSGDFIALVSKLPGIGGDLAREARDLKAASAAQTQQIARSQVGDRSRVSLNQVPGLSESFDPVATAKKIYPILQFRDKIVKTIHRGVSKIPGLEKLLEHISETLTAFVLGLLAPFIRPIIEQVTKVLKEGSSEVISSSAKSQLEPWTNARCDNPTHSMLSKDHFTNVLNSCAGRVATTILQYAVPRILYAWENPGVPADEVVNDVIRAFHHPAARSHGIQIQRDMFDTVQKWANETPLRHQLNYILGSESVRHGKNHRLNGAAANEAGGPGHSCAGHGKPSGSLWSQITSRDLKAMNGEPSGPAHNSTGPSSSHHSDAPSYGAAYEYAHPLSTSHSPAPPPPWDYGQGHGQQPYAGQWGQGPPPPQGSFYGGQQPPYPPYDQPPSHWGQGNAPY